jgi:hypothetical protein
VCVLCAVVAGTGFLIPAHAQPENQAAFPFPRADPLSTPINSPSETLYDEQLGTTFTQSFYSIVYNVTAVEQQDPSSGTGPAYLLNGLSNQGYWYQVGLSYNWEGNVSESGYVQGFNLSYNVFDPSGNVVLPANGDGGLVSYSGQVNPGDTVTLSLYFSYGNVIMFSRDLNTSAEASVTYSADGATTFIGLSSQIGNSNGFFTGLMTEWYHPAPYYGNEKEALYTDEAFGLTSAHMWMDEFEVNSLSQSPGQLVFGASSPLISYSDPTQLQEFSSNGATEYSNAYEFITGATSQAVSLTLSYSVQGGGTGYSPSTLTYVTGGVTKTATLGTSPSTFEVDLGSGWSVNPTLGGSTSSERWQTGQATSGAAISSQTIAFVYYNQFQVTITGSPAGEGTSTPTGSGLWEDAGPLSISATADLNYVFSTWSSSTTTITFANPRSAATIGTISGTGTITANFVFQHSVQERVSIAMSPKRSPPVTVTISGCDASVASITADGSPDNFTADAQCSLTFTAPTRTSSLIWEFNGSGNGSATWTYATGGNGTDVETSTLFTLDRDTVNFSVSGGGSGYSAPTLSYQALGSPQTYTVTAKGMEVDIDDGSSWSVTNPLSGSGSSERWQAPNSSVSGTSAGGATIAPLYYDQYQPLVSFSVADGGSGYSSPLFACLQFGGQFTSNASTTATGEWVDSGCSYTFTNPLAGSNSTERWQTLSAAGTVSSAAAVDPLYYKQFTQALSYSISGGGLPSDSSATGEQFGSSYSFPLNTTATKYWLDASVSIVFSSTIPGATDERWVTSTASVPANSSSAMTVRYFHQYQISFLYSVVDGPAPTAPTLACEQEASQATLALSTSPQTFWCDSGATVSATNPAPGSTSTERWSDNGQSFTVSGGASTEAGSTDTFTYYHQFMLTLSYSVIDGGSPSRPPVANETAFGKATSGTLSSSPSPFWLDSGSIVNVPASLLSSGGSERWITNATLPISVDSAITETLGYQHQDRVNVENAKTGGGSISPATQWYDPESTVSLVASPASGWNLGTWVGSGTGSYSGTATATDVKVEGPINETAVFYPGLDLSVGSGGSVTYSYGSIIGQASSGQRVLYVPPATNVTLVANPSSIFYSFRGWAIAHASGTSTIVIGVNAPATTEATFTYNLVAIGALAGVAVAVAAAAAATAFYRLRIHRRNTRTKGDVLLGHTS